LEPQADNTDVTTITLRNNTIPFLIRMVEIPLISDSIIVHFDPPFVL
jgi:hypothetical protein